MAKGWGSEDSGSEQMQQTLEDAVSQARSQLPQGISASHCDECDTVIPEGRRQALPGVRLCVACQSALDEQTRR